MQNMIVLTAEELECIREQAAARAEELEWQLRREIARLREVEENLTALVEGGPRETPRVAALRAAILSGRRPVARA